MLKTKKVGSCAKAARCARTYSRPKVIHERRGVIQFHTPQPIVNNFGGVKCFFGEQLWFWLNRKVGAQGSEDELRTQTS